MIEKLIYLVMDDTILHGGGKFPELLKVMDPYQQEILYASDGLKDGDY